MAQALRPKLTESNHPIDMPPDSTESGVEHQTFQECIRRTIWAAFIVDCLLSGGKHRPQSFQAARLDLSMPMGEEDFAFEVKPDEPRPHLLRPTTSTYEGMTVARKADGCDYSLCLIIKGLDIWSTLSQWICDGGRRSEPKNAQSLPWNEGSFWGQMKKALDCWRSSMSEKLHYSPSNSNLQAHIARNQGHPFVFINVIYHLNQLFLHREYIPFIPYRCSFPSGPIDPPLLVGQPPEDWWATNSTALFASAISIVSLLRAAEARGVELRTVFVAFCVYSAAVTLLYAQTWPFMAPGTKPPHEDLQWAQTWLEDTGALWKIVQGWKETLSTVSVIYEHVKSADPSRFSHPGGHGLEDLQDNIERLAEIPGTRTSGREYAAEILLVLARQNRLPGNTKPRELDRTETENGGQQEGSNYVYDAEQFDADAFIDPGLLASFMDGSMADMSQLPFESLC
jgi:hypothetical protein